jgi:serine/threonine-protein kinase PknG
MPRWDAGNEPWLTPAADRADEPGPAGPRVAAADPSNAGPATPSQATPGSATASTAGTANPGTAGPATPRPAPSVGPGSGTAQPATAAAGPASTGLTTAAPDTATSAPAPAGPATTAAGSATAAAGPGTAGVSPAVSAAGPATTSAGPATAAAIPGTAAAGPATAAAGPATAAAIPGTAAAGPGTALAGLPNSGTTAGPGIGSGSAGAGRPSTGGRRSGRSSRRNSGRRSSGSGRGRLGAGLVDVPPVPRIDPASALLRNPEVAEEKRFCSSCGKPVGRAQDGRPGPVEGVCPRDGTPFSFTPKLRPGELVAGQYDVQGSLAHGGLGWIYLALDRNVENRWVVLKGLVDAAGADAMAAAIAERRYLAQVSHPNIVAIHNFVQHPGEDGTSVGYIVMEYVGGSSLKELLEARRRPDGTLDPMPVPQAIAYALDILPALAHLHALGLAYCDFKPENVIQYDRQLKLIDLGAVIRMDDRRSALFGTVGYQAPEIVADGPSPSSDVYTVGRTLAVLALGISPTHRGSPVELPDPAGHPVLAAHESFHRLLRRATDPNPVRRFESTDEMADQLAGVLREVLALTDGEPRPAASTVFGPARGAFAPDLLIDAGVPGRPDPARVAGALPVPLVNPADEAAALLATAPVVDPDEVQRLMDGTAQPSLELRLRLVRAHLDAGDPDAARTVLAELADEDPDDWRLGWYGGIAALVAGAPEEAVARFDAVYTALPGEVPAKLALAAAAECAGWDEDAGCRYRLVARVDRNQADALFGLARVRIRTGDGTGALRVLDAVPESSSRYVAAQLGAVQAILLGLDGTASDEVALRTAARRVQRLPLDAATDHEVRATLLDAAVRTVDGADPATDPFLDCPWAERELRLALERCLRTSARLTSDPAARIALVDRANAARPRTWV